MISSSISTSIKLSKVSDFSALLFTWLITHCDDYGHMDGSPEIVRAIVIPLRKRTVKEVELALIELESVGLIKRYKIENKEDIYLEIVNWEDYQSMGPNYTRRARYPIPDWTAFQKLFKANSNLEGNSDNLEGNIKEDIIKNTSSLISNNKSSNIYIMSLPILANSQKKSSNSRQPIANEDLEAVFNHYKLKINAASRLTMAAKHKIRSRLGSYTLEDMLLSIDNFANNRWWMENNRDKGLAWFFSSDNRIDMFLSLQPEKIDKSIKV